MKQLAAELRQVEFIGLLMLMISKLAALAPVAMNRRYWNSGTCVVLIAMKYMLCRCKAAQDSTPEMLGSSEG